MKVMLFNLILSYWPSTRECKGNASWIVNGRVPYGTRKALITSMQWNPGVNAQGCEWRSIQGRKCTGNKRGDIQETTLREHGATEKRNRKKKTRPLGTCGERRHIPTRNPKVIHRIVYSGTGLKLGMHGNAHLEINEGKYRKRTAYMSASTTDKQISVLLRGSYPSLILNLRTV